MNWFLPLILAFSFSVRAPNELPNPYDYELSIAVEQADTYYLNRQWERELGKEYIDDEHWIEHTFNDYLYIRERYLNKSSQDIRYNQVDVRYSTDIVNMGYTLRHRGDNLAPESMASLGYRIDKRFNFIIASGQLVIRADVYANINWLHKEVSGIRANNLFDHSVYAKAKFGVAQNVNIFGLLRNESVLDKNYYQVKAGIELEFPTIGESDA